MNTDYLIAKSVEAVHSCLPIDIKHTAPNIDWNHEMNIYLIARSFPDQTELDDRE